MNQFRIFSIPVQLLLLVLVTAATVTAKVTTASPKETTVFPVLLEANSNKTAETTIVKEAVPQNATRNRDGRGLLDTIQSFVQTAQTVNSIFGGSNLANLIQSPIVQNLIKSQISNPAAAAPPVQNTNTNAIPNSNYYNNYYQQLEQQKQQQQQQQLQQQQFPSNLNSDYYHQTKLQPNYGAANTNQQYYGGLAQQPSQVEPSNRPGPPYSDTNNYYNQVPSGSNLNQASAASQGQGILSNFVNPQVSPIQQNAGNLNKQGFEGLGGIGNGGLGGQGGLGALSGLGGQGGLGGLGSQLGLGGLGGLASLAGLGGGGGGGGGSGSGSSDILSTLGELGLAEDLSELFSFTNVEKVIKNVNKFDSLQCIPRMVCQTIAKRAQDAADAEREAQRTSTTSTTTTTTKRPKYKNSNKRKDSTREGRLIPGLKIQGVDTALEQVVKFLDLMQLKDWSLYPYLKGAYHGNQVRTVDECAQQFATCPFSEDQLLYYFNNYKGGLFQSFRSDLNSSSSS